VLPVSPNHPLSVSWQASPQYQRTRTPLAMLARWASLAAQDGFRKVRSEPLITLGPAQAGFRSVALGESRLVEADIAVNILARDSTPTASATSTSTWERRSCSSLPAVRSTRWRICRNCALCWVSQILTQLPSTTPRSMRRVGTDGFRIGYQPTFRKRQFGFTSLSDSHAKNAG